MIVGICGKAGSGKGTAAEVLIERGYVRGKFSGALKDMLRTVLRYRNVDDVTIERMIEGDLKELPHPKLNGRTPRHFMQAIGQWGRNEIHPDFWVDTEMEATEGAQNLLFDDVRHDNEEAAIERRKGVIVQIVGRGGIAGDHVSEQFEPKNPIVVDNSGTIPELQDKIKTLASDLSWANVA